VYVGKRKGKHSREQDEINKLLFREAALGKTVVRLKGGDAMLFAHGGEEIAFLRTRGVEVEVIPGISAAFAAAAATQVPLTHRGIASSVAFISGHSNSHLQVPDADTLVYYMGASNIRHIASEVIRKGRNPETPVMMVYHISGADQKEYFTTLRKAVAEQVEYPTPLTIFIGEVVGQKIFSKGKKAYKQYISMQS
jgi:uroporphyrinogen III methyltransferase / synthase